MLIHRKDIWILGALWGFWMSVFHLFPSTDLMVSSFFYDAHTHTFPLSQSAVIQHLNNAGHQLVYLLAFWPFFGLIGHRSSYTLTQALTYSWFYFLCAFMLIEYGVKEIWLRPRPFQITLFGGSEPFLPPFQSLLTGNFHSFVSGHTSVWYGLICAAYTVYPQYAQQWITFSLFTGFLMGWLRVCIGQHFLSDTLFAGLFVCTGCVILDILATKIMHKQTRTLL